jgi:DNA-binding LacI/PurR family transcriptional regulator
VVSKRATAEDVARAAGVSRATVSRAFTPSTYVAAKTREKIEKAAMSLGYRRNALARALIKNESDLVAVVTGKMNNMFDAQVFDALTLRLQANRRWGLLVHANDEDVGRLLNEALSYPVQAVIVRSGSVDASTIEQCAHVGVPMILTGMEYTHFKADSVCCNNVSGAQLAANTLIETGAKRIAYLGGPKQLYSEMSRFDGFVRELNVHGLEPVMVERGDFTFESGFEMGKRMLCGPNRPDGVFCCNDAMAIGVLNAARNHLGLGVPDELAVVGFDDIPMAAWPCFQLTTIRNAVEPTVDAVSRVLEYRLMYPDAPAQNVRIEPELIRRQTA